MKRVVLPHETNGSSSHTVAPSRDSGAVADLSNAHPAALMTAVLESSRLVCSSLDLDEVLNLILRAAHQLSGAESVTVMLLDDVGEWLTIGASIGVSNVTRCELRLRVGEGLAGWVAQTGQPLHITNPQGDPRYREVPASHISNILSLPLRVRDRVVGVLNLSQYHKPGLFSDQVVQMIEVFASHAAIAIDNAATAARLRHAAARERLLNQINLAVRDMHHIDAVIDMALEGLGQTLELTHCALYRAQDTSRTTTFVKTNEWGLSEQALDGQNCIEINGWTSGNPASVIVEILDDAALIMAPIYQRGRCMSWLRVYAAGRLQRWRDDEVDLVQAVADHLAIAIAQGDLRLQEQRSRDLSESLSQLAAACNAMMNQEKVLSFILDQLARFIAYDSAGIWSHHEENYIILLAGQGYQSPVLNTILYTGPGTLNWRVVCHRRAYVVHDVRLEPGWQQAPDSDIIRSWIGVPLLVNNTPVGMLTIDKRQPDAFSTEDVQCAQAFADHVAVAIQNARLYQQVQTRASQLQALHRLSIRLSSQYEVKPLLDELARLLHETFQYYQVSVGLIEADMLVLKATRGQINDVEQFGEQQSFSPDRGLIGWAVRHNQTVLVNDVGQDSRYLSHPALLATHAELVVPIRGAHTLLGIIDMQSNRAGRFNQDDVCLVEALAGQTAVALENIARYDELRRTQEELLRSERLRALGELSSGVAHDFNNLLAGILGHAQLLLLDETEPSIVESLSVIERAALDGAATVRRLQDFAQMHHAPPEGIVDVNHVIEESLAITRPRWRDAAQSCGITIKVVRNLANVPAIIGDAPVLRELVTNLILNAIDAMPYGGELNVRTFESASYALQHGSLVFSPQTTPSVVIEVSDTGIGMSSSIQKRIFDPFFTTKGARGTGMGLAVAHGIVQRHKGNIAVQSVPGQGSTFTITLPTGVPNQARAETLHSTPDLPRLSGLVLVIEDELSVQQVLIQFLKRWGFQVTAVSSGSEALACFAPGRFDLVCTDLGMPSMSGWEVLDQVRQLDPNVATVLITGWGDQLSLEEVRLYGADQVLVKPFDAAQLYNAIKEALSRRMELRT